MDPLTTFGGSAPPSPAPAQPPAQSPPRFSSDDPTPRLSTDTPSRIVLGTMLSSMVGFALGAARGGHESQLRFRAEHAHKMPDSTAGWYLYHKSKNYHAAHGGFREGFRMGPRVGLWTSVALGLESTVDRCRGASDMFSTIVASLTVAGGFSLWHRLSVAAAARTAKSGFLFGLAYGGIQDLLGLFRGRPIGYVEFIRGRGRGKSDDTTSSEPGRSRQRGVSLIDGL